MPRRSNRRELIIDVATQRFLISGYDVVTVDELCELTNSTKGSFYHFFTNKESLAVDVVNEVWRQTQLQLDEIFSTEASPVEQLANEISRVASHFQRFEGRRYFVGCQVGTLAVGLRGKSPKMTRRLNFALTHMRQFYHRAFAEGLESGELISKLPAADLADRFQISLQGLTALGKTYSSSSIKIKGMANQLQRALKEE
ncbi:MAG: TetR/AcrR family transcriptional regulator [Gammaproteobacteria bacterium]|jgi:TetR/AcrR family transcriptional regulator, transcriptional repressor for nem operon|nr:TetR/AcrR family transcriptional regulator [Gammaproteobacteria bacterium]MBT4491641.1 TetR/AcrR family transcriptional regulator [Gammaproteobacteria bacterium]MBT7371401.1 TetR/AcrR family transcriptional regulator [Gammaproteobacteria bacterium]